MTDNIERLIDDYLHNKISKADEIILKGWILSNKENKEAFILKVRDYAETTNNVEFDSQTAFLKFLTQKNQKAKPGYKKWFSYAAVVGLLIGLTYVSKKLNYPAYGGAEQETVSSDDALLEGNITITLADGTIQVINKDALSTVTDKSDKVIAKSSAGTLTLANNVDTDGYQNPIFNEIHIPYGQKFKIQLTDGTKIWLNSGTRLKFVQNLKNTEGERKVFLDGEAFFDVSKDKKRPFIVETPDISIRVLGTQFNVNGYTSDSEIATTLVKGSVVIGNNHGISEKVLLKPNDQASFTKEFGTFMKTKVDTEIYTAWMQDRIVVNDLTFRQIMDRLERAYNVEIHINTKHLEMHKYKGEFENDDIASVLSIIAVSTPFNFKIKANEVIITEYKREGAATPSQKRL